MNPEEREKFYDDEIAPKLAELAKACYAQGLSFFAFVEWDESNSRDGGNGKTQFLTERPSLEMAMQAMLCNSVGNLDAFMIGVGRYCAEHGIDTSGSVYLSGAMWEK